MRLPPAVRTPLARAWRRTRALARRLTTWPRHREVHLACGATVVADRHDRHWARLARDGHPEPDAARFAWELLRPGDHVVDVGAHVGLLTTVLARRVGPTGRVLAFEPDPANRRRLRRALTVNGLPQVTVRDVALSDRRGAGTLLRPDGAWGGFLAPDDGREAFVRGFFPSSRVDRIPIQTARLDDLLADHPLPRLALVKVDVDGPELAVLRGARATLQRQRPALLVELSAFQGDHGTRPEDLFGFLEEAGYRAWGAPRQGGPLRPLAGPADVPLRDRATAHNLYCQPTDAQDDRWAGLWFTQNLAAR